MPTTPSVTDVRVKDTAVASLYMSQALSTSLVGDTSVIMKKAQSSDCGGDSPTPKPAATDQVKMSQDTGQNPKQVESKVTSPNRRLKPPCRVVLDKSDIQRGRDGFMDYARQHLISPEKAIGSTQKQSIHLSQTKSGERMTSDLATSPTLYLKDENTIHHYTDSSSDTVSDDINRFSQKKKREEFSESNTPVLIPVLKTKGHKTKSREGALERKVSVTEPSVSEEASSKSNSNPNITVSDQAVVAEGSQPRILKSEDSKTAGSGTSVIKRRISFPADSVLTAVIQDGDTPELLRLLSGRHGPGVVPGEGVDVCQANHVGLTALHHAVLANNLDAAKLLLCHGANANAQDVHGFSPLHTAAACGSLPLTTLLVLFGANVFALTHENELPVDVAKDLGIVRVLTTEMTRLVHQELWLTSLVKARADEAWLLVRKLLACVLLFILHIVSLIRANLVSKPQHKKSD